RPVVFARYAKSLRAHQWVKNLFVLAPAIFSKELFDFQIARLSISAFLMFCVVSSAVYVANDIRDVEADRIHPTKCKRPIASGELSITNAWRLVGVLLFIALALALTLPLAASAIALSYCVLNIGYSWGLKSIPYVDVLVIALGFVMRVLCGSAATGIQI